MERDEKRLRVDGDDAIVQVMLEVEHDMGVLVERENALHQAVHKRNGTRKRAVNLIVPRIFESVTDGKMRDLEKYLNHYMDLYSTHEFETMVTFADWDNPGRTNVCNVAGDSVELATVLLDTGMVHFEKLPLYTLVQATANDALNVVRYVLERMEMNDPEETMSYLYIAARSGALRVFQFLVERSDYFHDELVEHAVRHSHNPILPYLVGSGHVNVSELVRVFMVTERGKVQPVEFLRDLVRQPDIDVTLLQDGTGTMEGEQITPLENAMMEVTFLVNDFDNDVTHMDYMLLLVSVLLEHPDMTQRYASVSRRLPDMWKKVEKSHPGFYDERRRRVRQLAIPAGFSVQAREMGTRLCGVRKQLTSLLDNMDASSTGPVSCVELDELARVMCVDTTGKSENEVGQAIRLQLDSL